MIVWGFCGGDKGEGSTQNVKNYGIEVPSKTAGLYLVSKLRNLIFWDFVGFGGVWEEFLRYHRFGEYAEQGKELGLRSLWKPKVSFKSQSWENCFFFNIFGRLGGRFVDYLYEIGLSQ